MHAMVQAVTDLTKPVHCFKQFERNELLEMCDGCLSRAADAHTDTDTVTRFQVFLANFLLRKRRNSHKTTSGQI